MITALFSFLGGNVFRMIFGEIISFLNKKQDHAQEIERMQLQAQLDAAQHQRNQEAIKVQADLGVKTIQVQAEAAVGQIEADGWLEAVKATAIKTGIAWVTPGMQPFGPLWLLGQLSCSLWPRSVRFTA